MQSSLNPAGGLCCVQPSDLGDRAFHKELVGEKAGWKCRPPGQVGCPWALACLCRGVFWEQLSAGGEASDFYTQRAAGQEVPFALCLDGFLIKSPGQEAFPGKWSLGLGTIFPINSPGLLDEEQKQGAALWQPGRALKDASAIALTPSQALWAETMPPSREEAGKKDSGRTSHPERFPVPPRRAALPPAAKPTAKETFQRVQVPGADAAAFPERGLDAACTVPQRVRLRLPPPNTAFLLHRSQPRSSQST